ncbi:E3 ubiquitin-protein ligase SINAT3 [Camellia lanceoleosa]|uniref:E3 ubiquitin-protein ligase SINAT3 n=1 Tax=Camellia lanceoleosa TaxID=1840588 RepID=A0ACC0FFA6_9ERIC|nr:E3 ubiquitin-protein ligase SINAT3 [Camellia lanceoleosa]
MCFRVNSLFVDIFYEYGIGMDEDEIHHHRHPQFSSSKLHNNVVSSTIHLTTSVHELLECPVCTNSMYPPIYQIGYLEATPMIYSIQACDLLGWVSIIL